MMYLYEFGKIKITLKTRSVGQNEVHTEDMDKVIPAKYSESKCAFDGNTPIPYISFKSYFCVIIRQDPISEHPIILGS